jgi:hypothetical protein
VKGKANFFGLMGIDMRENTRMINSKKKNWEFYEIKDLLKK